MTNTIDQYREAKATYEKLHNQAKKELIARFNQLANEVLQIQRELKEDFGHRVVIPTKGKVVARPVKVAPAAPNPQIAVLEKKVAAEKLKLEKAVAAGKPEKVIQDRIYELEDELRLIREK
jgi:predicted nucleic acid-binding Zn ribbon protein